MRFYAIKKTTAPGSLMVALLLALAGNALAAAPYHHFDKDHNGSYFHKEVLTEPAVPGVQPHIMMILFVRSPHPCPASAAARRCLGGADPSNPITAESVLALAG